MKSQEQQAQTKVQKMVADIYTAAKKYDEMCQSMVLIKVFKRNNELLEEYKKCSENTRSQWENLVNNVVIAYNKCGESDKAEFLKIIKAMLAAQRKVESKNNRAINATCIRKTIEEFLKNAGIQVEVAGNPKVAKKRR